MDITIASRASCPIDADQILGCLEHVTAMAGARFRLYPCKVQFADKINVAAHKRILSGRIIALLEDEIRRLKAENLDLRERLENSSYEEEDDDYIHIHIKNDDYILLDWGDYERDEQGNIKCTKCSRECVAYYVSTQFLHCRPGVDDDDDDEHDDEYPCNIDELWD